MSMVIRRIRSRNSRRSSSVAACRQSAALMCPRTSNVYSCRGSTRTPDNRYGTALEFARAMQQVQQAYYGHATPVTVEGVPEYPSSMTGKRRVAPGPANVTRMDAPTGAWKKPLSITAVVVAALTAVVLTFVFVVMPHMDDTATRNRTSVSTPGATGDSNYTPADSKSMVLWGW